MLIRATLVFVNDNNLSLDRFIVSGLEFQLNCNCKGRRAVDRPSLILNDNNHDNFLFIEAPMG